MSTINGAGGISENAYDYVWASLTETNNVGNGITLDRNVASISFGVFGTFGTSGAVTIEGSFDGTTWIALKDSGGNAISMTAAGIVQVGSNPRYLRPHVTAGTGVSVSAAIHGTVFN